MWRGKLVLVIIFLLFVLIILRLFYWQVIVANEFADAAIKQYYFTLELPAVRGQILDINNDPLVTNQNGYLVYADKSKITETAKFIDSVASILDINKKQILESIEQPNLVWVPIKHKINEDTFQKLNNLGVAGLQFEKENQRYYPEASMAAQLLGFVGSDDNGYDKGYFGLEGYYNQALRGKSGNLLQEKDARGLPIILGTNKRIPAQDGQSLELYLDKSVQNILETELDNGINKYGASSGLVTIIDPQTGGIIASAAYPKYDQQNFAIYPVELYHNPLVADSYEPGSTFKVLIMAAALNENLITPQSTFDESGPVRVGQYLIKTWNEQYHGEMTATQILEKSSNPGMVFIGKKLGQKKFLEYLKKYGFGSPTDIDLEEEETPQLRKDSEWKEIDLATAAFGQGIAVTPIQMLKAITALANGGEMMKPRMVKNLIDPNGKRIEIKPEVVNQILKSTTTKVITEMMIAAVDNGEAKWAKPAGYRIAGKTGTAQIPVAGHYDDKKTIASFIGFAPADDPRFAMLVLLREPQSSPWGSETAAPLFFNIAKQLFTYYGISPKD